MEVAYSTLLDRSMAGDSHMSIIGLDGKQHPRIVRLVSSELVSVSRLLKDDNCYSLGGDHTIVGARPSPSRLHVGKFPKVLPILRSLHKVYGPISVIHFDAHLVRMQRLASEIETHSFRILGPDMRAKYLSNRE